MNLANLTVNSTCAVLVVEDDPLVRMMATDIVEDAGFTVLEAGDADQAMATLEAGASIRILFTDVDMPGSMDGLRLAAAVSERWPEIEIIVTSGKAKYDACSLPTRGVFVPKPYMPRDIETLLHSLRG